MNRVKYVPADAQAREENRKSLLVIECGGRARESDAIAYRRGWVRLSTLPPAERAKYRR